MKVTLLILDFDLMKNHTLLFIAIYLLTGCTRNEVEGIRIGNTLYEQQDYATNKTLCNLIRKALNSDSLAILELTNFNCGGAAGCYDLGSVFTQIIYRVGENKFYETVKRFPKQTQLNIKGFIEVGLEYGYNLGDNPSNSSIESQFPKLYKKLGK